MGIFDFVKNAGAKVFKREPDDKAESYKPLRQHVEEHGIDADDIQFRLERGVLVVEGSVPDQDTREKVILIVGNVEGVDKVDDRLRVGKAPTLTGSSVPGARAPLEAVNGTPGAPRPEPAVARAAAGGGGGAGGWTSRTYTVKKGDTLSAIAKETLGNANRYMLIFEANKPMLKDPDKIYPGQVLRIPVADSSATH
jgi:nucleoid-associated protein YgaU